MKAINRLLIVLCLIAFSYLLFYSPIQLYDLISGNAVPDFSLKWPLIRILTEPLYAFAFYALTLERTFYKPAVISWLLWVITAVFIYCKIKKKTTGEFFIRAGYGILLLTFLFVLVVLLPLPGPKLIKPENYIAVDIHSHTITSHDNLSLPYSNLKFHSLQGFDSFFVTEHNHTKGFNEFPEKAKFNQVFPGVQMQTRDRVSVLLLSPEEFDGNVYKDKRLYEIIDKAHKNNMLVIMPHWWKWSRHSFKELKILGIDGFEIYNCGYRNISDKERKSMIKFCQDNNLLMFGSTDWHGWGYMTDVWTVFQGDKGGNLALQLAEKPDIKIILYREKQSDSILRFIFEPFMAYYYYMKNADIISVISFMVWVSIIFILLISDFGIKFKRYLPLVISVFFAVLTIYFTIIYLPFRADNEIIISSIIPALIGFCVLWLILWRLIEKYRKDVQ